MKGEIKMDKYYRWLERYNWYKQNNPDMSDFDCHEMAIIAMEQEEPE